jgi:hypothetical protein
MLKLFLALIFPLLTVSGHGQAAIPQTPAGYALQAWLDAMNGGMVARVREYVKSMDSTQSVDWLVSLSQHSGGFVLLSVHSKSPRLVSFQVREKHTSKEAVGSIKVDPAKASPVTSFSLRPVPPGAIVDDITLDAAERERVLRGTAVAMKEEYLDPKVAAEMAAALLQDEQQSDIEAELDGGVFAFSLTKQLRTISHDKHVDVLYTPFRLQKGASVSANAANVAHAETDDCGITKATVLDGNIGYLKIDAFPDIAQCRSRIAATMRSINHVDCLIFDLRQNHGGDPRTVALVASYLFDHPTHLNDMYAPRSGRTESSWTQSPMPGNALAGKPAFVLTSAMTFSGGEEFCYDLKMLRRVTIVGERTGGGAHPVHQHRIDEYFTVAVPFAEPVNPISKRDWEGIGVTPDVSVKADLALNTASNLLRHELLNRK